MSEDSAETSRASRPISPPARKPFGLWLVQGYFAYKALGLASVAVLLFADTDFPYPRTFLASAFVLPVAIFVGGIVAGQVRSRGSRIACAVVLALSLARTLKVILAPPAPNPAFERHKLEIR